VKTTLLSHALERALTRLTITPEEIVELIDNFSISLGYEDGTKKVHKIFYSFLDDSHFVAIQDEENGEIITILPVEYHNRWVIPTDLFTETMDLGLDFDFVIEERAIEETRYVKRYIIRVSLRADDGKETLVDFPIFSKDNIDLRDASNDPCIRKKIRSYLIKNFIEDKVLFVLMTDDTFNTTVKVENI